MKLFAALGPGDIVAAHRAQISGNAVVSETSIIFSGQLLEYCRARGIEILALSHNRRADTLHDDLLRLENRRRWFDRGDGRIRYHLVSAVHGLYLAIRAWRANADLAIIDSGSAHYFSLALFRLVRIPVAVNFHNTLWPNGFEPTSCLRRTIRALDAWFFQRIAAGAIGCSPECGHQVRQLAGRLFPFFDYRSQFRKEDFPQPQKKKVRDPFRVAYVGRIEWNKGAMDVLQIAGRLRARCEVRVEFDVCGDGTALPELLRKVEDQRLDDIVHAHGRLTRPKILEIYGRAHAIVVPTRRDFSEGLPLVCAEAVLSGLPIVTSRLSNAIPVLQPAVVEVQPENIEGYVDAIVKLVQDQGVYDQLTDACPTLAQQFLDRSRSYPAAIDRLIGHLFPGWKLLEDYTPLFTRIA